MRKGQSLGYAFAVSFMHPCRATLTCSKIGIAESIGFGQSKASLGLAESTRMAHVVLVGNLRQFTGGIAEIDLEVGSVQQLFRKLGETFPELAPHLAHGLAVAIDGHIYQDAILIPIPPEAEVHVLPAIAGG